MLEIDKEKIKLDGQGKLMIDEFNIGYLMELIGEVEKKFNVLHTINKQLNVDTSHTNVSNSYCREARCRELKM